MWTGTNAGLSEWSGSRILPGIAQNHFKDTGIGGFEGWWKDLLEVEGPKDTDTALPHSGPGGSAPSHCRSLASGADACTCPHQTQEGQEGHLQLPRSGLVSVFSPANAPCWPVGWLLHMEHLWPLLNSEGLSILSSQPIFLLLHGLVLVSPLPPSYPYPGWISWNPVLTLSNPFPGFFQTRLLAFMVLTLAPTVCASKFCFSSGFYCE